MPNSHTAQLLVRAQADLGEGAIWDPRDRVLRWVDITANRLHAFDLAAHTTRTVTLNQPVSAVVSRNTGGVLVAVRDGIGRIDGETMTLLARPPASEHSPTHRFNDGKCDPAGRFWAGTMSPDNPGAGKLYRLDPDLKLHRMLEGVSVSNGLAWSLDARTLYYIDSPTNQVVAFDYRVEDGTISRKRTVVTVERGAGLPDGMTIDAEGMLWVAHWGGWCVRRWNPHNGRLLEEVCLPTAHVTSCAFAGAAFDQLCITTAASELTERERMEQPHAGDLFIHARPGLHGVPAFSFRG
jgi:sugar lactone lactonase YvrE